MPRGMFDFSRSTVLIAQCRSRFATLPAGFRLRGRTRGLPASRLGSCTSLLALGPYEARTEGLLGRVLVVRSAAQADGFDCRFAAAREFPDVIELDPRPRHAAMCGLAHERALPAVARPHRAL